MKRSHLTLAGFAALLLWIGAQTLTLSRARSADTATLSYRLQTVSVMSHGAAETGIALGTMLRPAAFSNASRILVGRIGPGSYTVTLSPTASPTVSQTPTPTPTPTGSPVGNVTATASPVATESSSGIPTATPTNAAVPGASLVTGGGGAPLPPEFAGTPSGSLPANFGPAGDTIVDTLPTATAVALPPPSAPSATPTPLVVNGPVRLPVNGLVSVPVVLRGQLFTPGKVEPILSLSTGTLVTSLQNAVAYGGILSPPHQVSLGLTSPAADQAFRTAFFPAVILNKEATYEVATNDRAEVRFEPPASLSLPAQPPSEYDAGDLRVYRYDVGTSAWVDVPTSASSGPLVVAGIDRSGLYAVTTGGPGGFRRFWVQAIRPTALWSGIDSKAVVLGTAAQWDYMVALSEPPGGRLQVRYQPTGGIAYVDAADVGPSGPP